MRATFTVLLRDNRFNQRMIKPLVTKDVLSLECIVLDAPVVWCDPRLLVQTLSNLLDNALRYIPAGSTIRVVVTVSNTHWQLAMADNGPGLPPGHERDVFKKFYRGRAEPAGAGTGLGLAICAAVARLLRAR